MFIGHLFPTGKISVELRCELSGLLMLWQVHMWSVTQKASMHAKMQS